MEENWKVVEGFETYSISSCGSIRNNKTSRILKPSPDTSGYLGCSLRSEGKTYTKYIHRLVSEAFLTPVPGKTEVNHIDGNKNNNSLSNLEWSSREENMQHSYTTGLNHTPAGEAHPSSKLTWEIVDWIRANYKPRDKEFGCRAIANKLEVAHSLISAIINNKTWKR